MSAKDLENIVTCRGEADLDTLAFMVDWRPELYVCLSLEGEHPVPASKACHDEAEASVEHCNEVHHLAMLLEGVVTPARHNRHNHVRRPQKQVHDEKQEVSLVLKAYTIVYPRTVMVHEEDAFLADGAVV